MPLRARVYIAFVIALGLLAIGAALADWGSAASPLRMASYVAFTAVASALKLKLPGLDGTYSLSGVFLLAGAVYFTLPEVVMAAVAGALVQSYVAAERRPAVVQVLFSVANEAFSIALASIALAYLVRSGIWPARPALLAAAAAIYFVLNTGLVSGVLTLLGGKGFLAVNEQWYSWSFPYYLLGAAAVGVIPFDGRPVDVEAFAILVPLAYLSHFFCGLAGRRADEVEGRAGVPPVIPGSARAFAGAIAATAASFVAFGLSRQEPVQWPWFLCCLALAAVTATWKVSLPGLTGSISVHYVVVLVAIARFSLSEALAIAAVGPLVQLFWRAGSRPQPIQIVFNVAAMVLSAGVTYSVCRILAGSVLGDSLPGFLVSAAALQFLTNTLLVSGVLSLVERAGIFGYWRRLYFWAFPVYMVGAAAAAVMLATVRAAGWIPSLLILPLMAMVQMSYRLHLAGHLKVRGRDALTPRQGS